MIEGEVKEGKEGRERIGDEGWREKGEVKEGGEGGEGEMWWTWKVVSVSSFENQKVWAWCPGQRQIRITCPVEWRRAHVI